MCKLLLGLVLVLGLWSSVQTDQTLEEKLRADSASFIDEILTNLRQILVSSGYNKIKLPKEVRSFSQNLVGIRWQGEVAAYDGILRGMETIHRVGSAGFLMKGNDIVFSTDLGFDNVTAKYNLKAQFMGRGPQALVTGKLKSIRCFLEAKTDIYNPGKVVLTKFHIHDIGTLEFDIDGLGTVLNFIAEEVSGALGNLVKTRAADVVEKRIKDLLNKLIASSKFTPNMDSQILINS